MLDTSGVLRVCLFACLAGMALIAILYLRLRKLPTFAYLCWGLLAVMLPVIGPYLVISAKPGIPRNLIKDT